MRVEDATFSAKASFTIKINPALRPNSRSENALIVFAVFIHSREKVFLSER